MAWLIALEVLCVSLYNFLKGPTDNRSTVVFYVSIIVFAGIFCNFVAIARHANWRYVGNSPFTILQYSKEERLSDRLDVDEMERVLYKVAMQYGQDITFNQKRLGSLRFDVNLPIYVISVGILFVLSLSYPYK